MEASEGRLRRLRNLPSFKDKTDEELRAYLENRTQRPRKIRVSKQAVEEQKITDKAKVDEREYQKRYTRKLKQLIDEFGVDMNDANDRELANILVRVSLQLEDVDIKIRGTTQFDTKTLKELGEYQKSLINGVTEIQEKLGITRKARKEKQIDDIPQYLKQIRLKARDFWNRNTTAIKCGKDDIELGRYWINFPDLAWTAGFELECPKCGEKIVYRK